MAGSTTIFYLLGNVAASGAAAVRAIVGTAPPRIFPMRAPQVYADPYITYMQIGTVPTNQKDAVSGYDKVDYDVELFHKDFTILQTLEAAVRTALDKKTLTTQGDNVDEILFVRSFNGFDDQAQRYKITMQFRLIIKR